MTKAIYFDMDGTIANLYGEKNWLQDLRAEKVQPYVKAKPMVNMAELKDLLLKHRALGTKIGIITWLAKGSTKAYDKQVMVAKIDWLDRHFGKGFFDNIHMVAYGTPKHEVATIKNAVIFDDNEEVRSKWNLGTAYTENDILTALAK